MVQESIIQSLKGAIADMACYIGSNMGIDHILCKLSVIFVMVASFDILMQNFHKVSWGTMRRFPHLPQSWRSGTLNHIQLLCSGRMTDLEAQQHLKGHLFHRVRKHVCESIEHLYSTPSKSYSQMMVTWKAKTKMRKLRTG